MPPKKKNKLSPLEFKKLKQEWYRKLERGGFKDIENERGKLRHFTRSSVPNVERQLYYRRCHWFLWDHPFLTLRERRIWELHCDGLGREKIAAIVTTLTENQIRLVLEKLNEALLLYQPEVDDEFPG